MVARARGGPPPPCFIALPRTKDLIDCEILCYAAGEICEYSFVNLATIFLFFLLVHYAPINSSLSKKFFFSFFIQGPFGLSLEGTFFFFNWRSFTPLKSQRVAAPENPHSSERRAEKFTAQ